MNHGDAGGGESMFWVQTVPGVLSTFYCADAGSPLNSHVPTSRRSPCQAANEGLKFVPQVPSAQL